MAEHEQQGLETPVRYVRGVGGVRAQQLERLDIHTAGDLLLTLPRRYEDRRRLDRIADLRAGQVARVAGHITAAGWVPARYNRGFFEAVMQDGSGLVRCRWYHAAYLKDQLHVGERLVIYGKVTRARGGLVFSHPEFEPGAADEESESLHFGRVVPIYPLTEHLAQRTMRRILWNAVERFVPLAVDILPPSTRARHGLPGLADAIRQAHFPDEPDDARAARRRLVFDEFLCLQLVLVARKLTAERELTGIAHDAPGALRGRFLESLPFSLTAAQKRVLEEVQTDLRRPRPMHRLLQGDVGSGKTVVAACALLDVVESGSQVAVMAPTEILAAQHVQTFSRFLAPLGVRLAYLSGERGGRVRQATLVGLRSGGIQVAIGTHALIQKRVAFRRLGLVIIDEQHKFGVEQRGLLYGKGARPDVLVMTATPIPRTLAMTLYGDLDVSVIDELPPGRQAVGTRVFGTAQLPQAYAFIRRQVAAGRQAYLVYPLVAESEESGRTAELKAAETMFQRLGAEVFTRERLGLLHGQMPSERKAAVMEDFRAGRIDILAATTVVEVGVDVPNATVMLVENAERFGLATLHQLRGRIGRGAHKSWCLLQGDPRTLDSWRRLKVMAETSDGFRIAEEDLRIRGMGNILGREQSGFPALRVGDLACDQDILQEARAEAFRLLKRDPKLRDPAHAGLREAARALYKRVRSYVRVG